MANNNNIITLSSFGNFCKAFHAGNDALTCTEKSMTEFGIENAKNLIDFARKLYIAVGTMMDLRQSQGIKVDTDQLAEAEGMVKKLSDTWFKEVGTRAPKTEGGQKRPCYGTRYADFAILGEILAQATAMASNDPTKVGNSFFELMVINTARILTGEKLGRVTESEYKKAKATVNKAKADKAKATKKANQEEANNAAAEKEETANKLQSLERSLATQMSAIEQAIALVNASHATAAEKAAIVAMLNVPTVTVTTDIAA